MQEQEIADQAYAPYQQNAAKDFDFPFPERFQGLKFLRGEWQIAYMSDGGMQENVKWRSLGLMHMWWEMWSLSPSWPACLHAAT